MMGYTKDFLAIALHVEEYQTLRFNRFNAVKVNNRNTRARCEICSKLTIKTPERRHRRSGVFIVNFEHISHFALVFLQLTLIR